MTDLPGPLVEPDWLLGRLGDPELVLLEVDERPALYRRGHIPGAHALDWHTDLQDPVTRDLPSVAAMRALWRRVGVEEGRTVVLYGDQDNWYACFAYWLFTLYGLRDMAVLDGGRPLWVSRALPMETDPPPPADSTPPEPAPHTALRAAWWNVLEGVRGDAVLVDVRSPAEYRGELLTEPGYPEEAAQRGGHVPGAANVPWDRATRPDGRFAPLAELRALYAAADVTGERPVITYCRIGERSAHTWFVLHELLGFGDVRNYDGSWTEWGSMIGMPVAQGDAPGRLTEPAGPHGVALDEPF